MSTSDTVISTPELLERILFHLHMRELLTTAPLVSKTWQTTTLTPALQRALFFLPDHTASPRIQNLLLAEFFPLFFNPKTWSHTLWPYAEPIKSMPWSKKPDAFKRSEASWRRMLVTQAPPQKLGVTETYHSQSGTTRERRAVLDDPSLRMGDLYDLTLQLVDRMVCSFSINWHLDGRRENDLILAVNYGEQCSINVGGNVLDRKFYSDAHRYIDINFGQLRSRLPSRLTRSRPLKRRT